MAPPKALERAATVVPTYSPSILPHRNERGERFGKATASRPEMGAAST